MNTIHKTSYLQICYDEDFNGLYIKWTGYTDSTTFRAGINKIFEVMEENNTQKTLTDVREHRGISPDDQEYASQLSIQFDKDNWQVIRALTVPEDVFARFALQNVNQKVEKAEQFRKMFNSLEEAKEWLIEYEI